MLVQSRVQEAHRPLASRRALLVDERDDGGEDGRGEAGAEDDGLGAVVEEVEEGAVGGDVRETAAAAVFFIASELAMVSCVCLEINVL